MPAGPSLYRRHRPRTFADVVGQEHVVRTLRNAIEQSKVHHAYLFVGSRGTGKTSMAKILASCLNCERGPTVEPCGACDSCTAIASATSLDVIEMDAASNNSVDDIRELRDSVQFAPVSGRYKVYILDEAHMLSTAAWNAFLKTLEEPPPSTIFVLATTEAHKVMDTVVDRCHRFDFTRPTVEQLAAVVGRVAQQEGMQVPPEAVALVARHATGSFRDALGTLEQLVTYSGATIETRDVLAVLGVADDELLFGALDAVGARDARAAWQITARLAESGRDAAQFLRDLEGHARDLLVVQTLSEVPSQLAMTPERDDRLRDQASRIAGGDVVRLLDLVAAGLRLAKDGADAQTQLEIALVKAASPEVDASTRALLARLERLEAALAQRGSAAPAPVAAPAMVAAPAPVAPPASTTAAPSVPAAVAPPPEPVEPAPSAPPAVVPVAAAPPPSEPPPPGGDIDFPGVVDIWPAVLSAVSERHMAHAMALEKGRPVAVADRTVTLAFDPSAGFHRKRAEDAACRELVQEAFRTLLGVTPRLEFITAEASATEDEVPLDESAVVARLKDEFDAEEIMPDDQGEQA